MGRPLLGLFVGMLIGIGFIIHHCTCYEGKVYVLVVACVGLAPHGWPQVACASLQLS